MTFLQLLIALGLERLMPHWMQYRIYYFFTDYLDRVASFFGTRSTWLTYLSLLLAIAMPLLLIVIIESWLQVILLGNFLFGMLVLFYCLGPKDLALQVDEMLAACERQDEVALQQATANLLDENNEQDSNHCGQDMAAAMAFEALDRIFGVLFWFALAGPAGAMLFRTTQLVSRHYRNETSERFDAAQMLYWIVAWLPSRLLALGYALAGHFTQSLQSWFREAPDAMSTRQAMCFFLANGASGALDLPESSSGEWEETAFQLRNSMALIWRTLLIWLAVIALLTIGSWMN